MRSRLRVSRDDSHEWLARAQVLVDAFFPQASPAFDEIQKQFATEFDYRGECKNAIEVRLAPAP